MAGEFQAGSIFVELKAQAEGVQKGIAAAKQSISGLGDTVKTTAGQVNAGGATMAQSFGEIDKASVQLTAKIARMTQRLLGLQLIVQNFGGRGGQGAFGRAMQTSIDSLSTFAAIVSVFPNKVGLIVGGIAAIGVAIASLVGPSEESRKRIEELQTAFESLVKKKKSLEEAGEEALRSKQIRDRLGVVDDALNPNDRSNQDLEFRLQERERLIQKIAVLERQKIADPHGTSRSLQDVNDDIRGTEAVIGDLNKEIAKGQVGKAFDDARKHVSEFREETTRAQTSAELFVNQGLVDPLEAARQKAQAAEVELRKLIDLQAELNKARPGAGNELSTDVGLALEKTKSSRSELNRTVAVDRMAQDFSAAIGEGVRDGILSGASAMETLARIGANLFDNFVTKAVENLQTGLASAFKAVTGVAGEEFAGLITGIAGLVGGIFARRQAKSSETFGQVRSAVTSTEALRGIVAGPSNVAIAAVGENLERAVEPLRAQMEIAVSVLVKIEQNTRGGGGAKLSFAGAVPTT